MNCDTLEPFSNQNEKKHRKNMQSLVFLRPSTIDSISIASGAYFKVGSVITNENKFY
jgi:hypothetical protein